MLAASRRWGDLSKPVRSCLRAGVPPLVPVSRGLGVCAGGLKPASLLAEGRAGCALHCQRPMHGPRRRDAGSPLCRAKCSRCRSAAMLAREFIPGLTPGPFRPTACINGACGRCTHVGLRTPLASGVALRVCAHACPGIHSRASVRARRRTPRVGVDACPGIHSRAPAGFSRGAGGDAPVVRRLPKHPKRKSRADLAARTSAGSSRFGATARASKRPTPSPRATNPAPTRPAASRSASGRPASWCRTRG